MTKKTVAQKKINIQDEIIILELRVKKAKLEKELRELENVQTLLGTTGNNFVQVPYYPNPNTINPFPYYIVNC